MPYILREVLTAVVKIEVNEGKIPMIIGIGTILFGILYGVLCTLYPGKSTNSGALYYLMTYIFAIAIILAGVWLCLDAWNRKLIVENDKLCYVNSFGRKSNFALSDISICRTAMENGGNRNYLKLYDKDDKKLCKLEYNMSDSFMFLQYLIDNQVEIECTDKSGFGLKMMLGTAAISYEEMKDAVHSAYKEAKELVGKWIETNREFGVEWKMGITAYLKDGLEEKKQLWEQEGCGIGIPDYVMHGMHGEAKSCDENPLKSLPEGYIIAIEGYLLKDGEFVVNKKNRAVCFFVPVICVTKSLKINEELKISNNKEAVGELSAQLATLAEDLPRNRYHTEELVLKHELREII